MLLPLEEWLEHHAEARPHDFPSSKVNYFQLYSLQKAKFREHIYPYVNAGMITFERGNRYGKGRTTFYSDHGEDHVNAVIKTAGRLLGCKEKSSEIKIEPYEVYLLLMSILSHDAGNIEGRDKHEIKVQKLLRSDLTKVLSDKVEILIIDKIAKSHTGKGIVSEFSGKDTINDLKAEDGLNDISFRPRIIAALLRFADEVCEDRSRIPQHLLTKEDISKGPSAPFLYFGLCITSVSINLDQKSIQLQLELTEEQVKHPLEFAEEDGDLRSRFLIEEVLARLSKIKREKAYCFRFLHGIIEFTSIVAVIKVLEERIEDEDEEYEILYVHDIGVIDLSYEPYPSADDSFLKRHEDYFGEAFRERVLDKFATLRRQ